MKNRYPYCLDIAKMIYIKWTFITNHAAVLTTLDRKENLTSRDISIALDITERTVIRIINDLAAEGYVTK